MKKLFTFILLCLFPFLVNAQLHPQIPNDPYEFHYFLSSEKGRAEGYLTTLDLEGNPQRFALAELTAWTWYAHPPRGRQEDRLIIAAKFEGTNMEVRAYLKWEGGSWVLSLEEEEDAPFLGVGHDRDEGSYTQFGYIQAEPSEFRLNYSPQGEISLLVWEYDDGAIGPFPNWMRADQSYVTGFSIQANLVTDYYLMREVGQSRYSPEEARLLDTHAWLESIDPEDEARFFADPEGEMEKFTQNLVAGVDDDFLALKIIHDWVTSRIYYDKECYQNGQNLCPTDPYGTVRNRKSVCEGYADLMEEMGSFAGLPIRSIGGYVKGGGFYEEGVPSRHAYNIVFVNDQWLLLDATHDTGNYWEAGIYTDGKQTNNKLFVPMEYTWWYYHPYRREYQFREPLLTYEEFEGMDQDGMNISFAFDELYRQELALEDSLPFRIQTEEEVYSLRLRRNQDTKLSWSPGAEEGIPAEVFLYYLPDEIRLDLASSTGGPHRLYVHAKSPGMDRGSTVLALYIDSLAPKTDGFPKVFWDWSQRGGELMSPLTGSLSICAPQYFAVKLPGAQGAALRVENSDLSIPLNRSGEQFSLDLGPGRFPQDLLGEKLRIYAQYPDLNYTNALLEWTLTP